MYGRPWLCDRCSGQGGSTAPGAYRDHSISPEEQAMTTVNDLTADAHAETEGLPLREQVYGLLRDDILNGRVSARDRLTEPKLSKKFDVSRTPVREALSRLLADGLVERADYGYAVVVPTLVEIQNLYELRITLELQGITRCIERPGIVHDEALLLPELERWRAMQIAPPEPDPSFVLEDEQFHRVLSLASGNPQLTAVLVSVSQRIRAVRMYDFLEPGRITLTIDEHIEITELVLQKKLSDARDALRTHVGKSLSVVMSRAGATGRLQDFRA